MKRIIFKRKHYMIAAAVFMGLIAGLPGGLLDYLSPSVNVDEDVLMPPDYNVAASAEVPSVSASGAILIDGKTGEVLWEKYPDKKLYPASTTKILTALVALEKLEQLGLDAGSKLVVPAEAEGVEGSSVYLEAGELITVEELLYGLMLRSGNDSAVALAACFGGGGSDGVANFVEMMNERAAELGCSGSHFTNPSGLFDENHYTTARDLAAIASEAMKRVDFRKIAGSRTWSGGDAGRSFTNKNKTIFQYEGATGVKIGFTEKSGRTLVASAERGGRELIAVVLDDSNWFNDAYRLLDYGFALERREAPEKGGHNGV